jgi:hypothetical protein
LPDKRSVDRTVREIKKSLKPGGKIIAMGPNINVLHGKYWDFWDHHVAISDQSISKLLQIHNFEIEKSYSKFLPYNMVCAKKSPLFLIHIYLNFPFFMENIRETIFNYSEKGDLIYK